MGPKNEKRSGGVVAPGWAWLRGVAVAAVLVSACSAIVDADSEQCKTDADCIAKGAAFAGMVCSGENICVKPGSGPGAGGGAGSSGSAGAAGSDAGSGGGGAGGSPPAGCKSNQECVGQLGDFHICRKTDSQCVKLLSPECTLISGDYKNDNAIFLGSIVPSQGDLSSLGKPIENSMVLALRDFNDNAGGLPSAKPGSPGRPLVLVSCSDDANVDKAIAAAKHLSETVKVPAIVGAATSGITIKMTTQVTIPNKVFSISPSATSVAITSLQDDNLVWRTSPSDAFQANAIAALMPQMEADLRARNGLKPTDPIRVAIVNKGDAYGKGLADALVPILSFNGKAALDNAENFFQFNYGDPDDPQNNPTKYPEAITQTIGFKPHLIFLFGTNEGVTDVFTKVEQQWPAATGYFPQYVFADGGFLSELWDYLKANDPSDTVRKRVFGTVPGTNNLNYKSFLALYKSQISDGTSPETFGSAGGYDGIYLIAYAIASLGDKEISGPNIADAMKRMVGPGTPIKVGASQINTAIQTLAAGNNIDFDGASGPLNFDVNTGEAPSDIQFWCIPKGADGKATVGAISPALYEAAKGQVTADALAAIKSTCKLD